jgi:hypothetical protein
MLFFGIDYMRKAIAKKYKDKLCNKLNKYRTFMHFLSFNNQDNLFYHAAECYNIRYSILSLLIFHWFQLFLLISLNLKPSFGKFID